MRQHQEQLRKEAENALATGQVDVFIGYQPGFEVGRPVPAFAREAEGAKELVLDEFSGVSLSKYLLREVDRAPENPSIGIVAKGCDGLGIERLLYDQCIGRDQLHIVGVGCRGIVDPEKAGRLCGNSVDAAQIKRQEVVVHTPSGKRRLNKEDVLLDKCLKCENPTPRVYDVLLGDEIERGPVRKDRFEGVRELEQLSADERYEFWVRQFDRCLRCFACRNVCPACSCVTCSLEEEEPQWLSRNTSPSEQFMFHFTRAYHVAGRCVSCGACEEVCPVGVPLMLLNEKLLKDVGEMFEEPAPHLPSETEPLGEFSHDDPEGWRGEAGQS